LIEVIFGVVLYVNVWKLLTSLFEFELCILQHKNKCGCGNEIIILVSPKNWFLSH